MGPFNNREIATAVWLLLFAWWALRKPEIRKSLADALRAFCHAKILVSVLLMSLYVGSLVSVLHAFGMWNLALLKDTIVWFFVGAFAMMMRFATADDTAGIFRKIVEDSIKVVIVLEFLVNTYTFPLGVELVLVPTLTFIAMIDAVASMNREHALVAKIIKTIQALAGFLILGIAVRRAIADVQTLNSFATVRSITLAPLLSLGMFPFIYIMLVISQYEQLFIRLDFGTEKPPQLKRYLHRQILVHAGLSLGRLRRLQRDRMVYLMHAQTRQDVDRILASGGSEEAEQSPPAYPEGRADAPSGPAEA